jgi:hypothetical protein
MIGSPKKQPGLFVIFVSHTPAQYARVSAVQLLSQVFFQQGELASQQVRVAEGAGLHDRPFDDGDDVPGQLEDLSSHSSLSSCFQERTGPTRRPFFSLRPQSSNLSDDCLLACIRYQTTLRAEVPTERRGQAAVSMAILGG